MTERAAPTDGGLDRQLARGWQLIELRRPAEAVDVVGRLVGQSPNDPRIWRCLATALAASRDFDKAIDAGERAVALDPDNADGYLTTARALASANRRSEALALTRRALTVDPHRWDVHGLHGMVLSYALVEGQGKPSRAEITESLAAGKTAVRLDPQNPDAQNALGLIETQARHWDEAEQAFRRALLLDPQHHPAHNNLARVLTKKKVPSPDRLAQAATGFAIATVIDPSSRTSRSNLERTLLNGLTVTAALILVSVFWVGRWTSDSDTAVARVVPVVGLLVPGWFALRFWQGLTPPLRARVIHLLTRTGLRVGYFVLMTAVACLVLAALAPHGARQTLVVVAGLLALSGRLAVMRHTSRRFGTSQPLFSTSLLWFLCVAGIAFTLVLLASISAGGGTISLVLAAACAAGSGWALVVIMRRRSA
jgi:Flp pilus assembly protein TadD